MYTAILDRGTFCWNLYRQLFLFNFYYLFRDNTVWLSKICWSADMIIINSVASWNQRIYSWWLQNLCEADDYMRLEGGKRTLIFSNWKGQLKENRWQFPDKMANFVFTSVYCKWFQRLVNVKFPWEDAAFGLFLVWKIWKNSLTKEKQWHIYVYIEKFINQSIAKNIFICITIVTF